MKRAALRLALLLCVLLLLAPAAILPAYAQGGKDSDGDGLTDDVDKCPQQPGPKENGGCPWPDSDGDGLTDDVDKCPQQPGPKENGGCPAAEPPTPPAVSTDRDGDGVPDDRDTCPDQAGPAESGGCPLAPEEPIGAEPPDSVPQQVNETARYPLPALLPFAPCPCVLTIQSETAVPIRLLNEAPPFVGTRIISTMDPARTYRVLGRMTVGDQTWYVILSDGLPEGLLLVPASGVRATGDCSHAFAVRTTSEDNPFFLISIPAIVLLWDNPYFEIPGRDNEAEPIGTGPCQCEAATQGYTGVNIHNSPSLDAPIIGTMDPNRVYSVNLRLKIGDEIWYRLAEIESGWVSGPVTRSGGDCDNLMTLRTRPHWAGNLVYGVPQPAQLPPGFVPPAPVILCPDGPRPLGFVDFESDPALMVAEMQDVHFSGGGCSLSLFDGAAALLIPAETASTGTGSGAGIEQDSRPGAIEEFPFSVDNPQALPLLLLLLTQEGSASVVHIYWSETGWDADHLPGPASWQGSLSVSFPVSPFELLALTGDQTPVQFLDSGATPVLIQSDPLPVLPTGTETVFGDVGFLYFRSTPGDQWWGACSGGGCVALPLVLQPAE